MAKAGGMRLRVAEMKTCDAWTMKGKEGVKRRRETRALLLIGSLCHCLGPLWVMRMLGQDQLQYPYPCPILILCSSEQSPGHHWDSAVPLCPHKSTVGSREGWESHGGHPSKAHTLQMRDKSKEMKWVTQNCTINNLMMPFRHYKMLKCPLDNQKGVDVLRTGWGTYQVQGSVWARLWAARAAYCPAQLDFSLP